MANNNRPPVLESDKDDHCVRCGAENVAFFGTVLQDGIVPVCWKCWFSMHGPFRRFDHRNGRAHPRELPFFERHLLRPRQLQAGDCYPHHYIVDAAGNSGTCKKCGAIRQFYSMESPNPISNYGVEKPMPMPEAHTRMSIGNGGFTYRKFGDGTGGQR